LQRFRQFDANGDGVIDEAELERLTARFRGGRQGGSGGVDEGKPAPDFHLKTGSPAGEIGFEPWEYEKAGLYGAADWVEKPRQIERPRFTPPEPPEPEPIDEDFEDVEVGGLAPNAETLGEGAGARIRVSGDTGAESSRSLKFTDAPGLEHNFYPYLVYKPRFTQGTAVASFWLHLEKGATMYHQWRDRRRPYRVGPSLWFHADGKFAANGEYLLTLPHDEWLRIEIKFDLGREADGAYDLAVTLPDGKKKEFPNMPCNNKDFHRLDWFGFVADADKAGVFYLDEIKLEVIGEE